MARWDRAWFRQLDVELVNLAFLPLVEQTAVRRVLARDPVAFAMIYLGGHVRSKDTGAVTFAEVHFEWARKARAWSSGDELYPMDDRNAYVAPRETGKSTWWYLILPLWAAANGHKSFIAAFADTSTQAEIHLKTFKRELDTNPLLRLDYPDLTTPARKQSGSTVADSAGMLVMRSGFVFAARGIDASSLGMKVGDRRPDLLIFDDVEPDEARYSAALVVKRLGTILDAIFPLNIRASVVMVGTVTMPGSIMHQLVKAAHGAEHDPWVEEQNIAAHHYRAIIHDAEGAERSLWPAKWPLSWLLSIRHTRMYAKNYDNDPMAREGVYWRKEDFRYQPALTAVTRTILAVDPAVTTKKASDYTGLAVISYSALSKQCLIRRAYGVKLTGQHLRRHVIERVLVEYPDITDVVIETNQGGDLWLEVFHHLPNVRVRTITATVSKEIRFADALTYWQRGQVLHETSLPQLEEQAVAFPNGANDDVIDAGVTGVLQFLKPERKVRAGSTVSTYVGA